MAKNTETLGDYLKGIRTSLGLSLRAVEEVTDKAVTNGYLSQIENGTVNQPSPNVLYHLAEAYSLDYGDLLIRAGHRIPQEGAPRTQLMVAGMPLRALEELTDDEAEELRQYVEFLRSRRQRKND